MKYNKFYLTGGNELTQNKQIETFLSIIIIGYFGIKIVYGFFFNFHPNKYYYRNIEISSNSKEESNETNKNITLNAYVPGMWNNELSDFITAIVLSFIIYVYTNVSSKSFIDVNGNLSLSFIFGYIIGLGYPVLSVNYLKFFKARENGSTTTDTSLVKYYGLTVLLGFIMFVFIMNYNSIDGVNRIHKNNYMIYGVIIILLFFGLIVSKKNINTYSSVTYFHNNGENCTFKKNGILQSSGDTLKITAPFVAFIILTLFSYEPSEISMKNLYVFVYSMLLGIFVSSMSYYGLEYFLQKEPLKECNDISECILKKMPLPLKNNNIPEEDDSVANTGTYKQLNNITKISWVKSAIIIFIILISAYLISFHLKK